MEEVSKREGIISKIENCLRRAEATTHEGERQAALQAAARLMEKYAIEQAELSLASDAREEIIQKEIVYSNSNANLPGKWALMNLACEIAGGVRFAYITGSRHEQRGVLLGFPTSIAAAELAYASLFTQAKSGAWTAGYTGKAQMTSFMVGFARGAHVKLMDWKAAREERIGSSMALALVDRDKEVDDAMNAMAQTVAAEPTRDAQAERAGTQAGMNADLGQTGLSGGTQDGSWLDQRSETSGVSPASRDERGHLAE